MTVAQNHRAIEAEVASTPSGNHFDFGGQEILFLDIVFLSKQLERVRFDRLLRCQLLYFCFVGVVLFSYLVIYHEGTPSHQHVEIFTRDSFRRLLLHLVFGEVDQQIRHAEHGVTLIFAHVNRHDAAIFLGNDTMQCERYRDPLVVLDASVVMRIEMQQLVALEQRVLLEVEARRIDVRTQDVEPTHERLFTQMHEDDRFAMRLRVDLVARFESTAFVECLVQVLVAGLFSELDRSAGNFALGLVR